MFWSRTGNTEQAAHAIKDGLEESGARVVMRRVEEIEELDYFDYDLVCLGFPSYQWTPPEAVMRVLKEKHRRYARDGRVKVNAPPVVGMHALVFCTYSGPHTGIDEAIPAVKVAAQFFEHLGIRVADEWYVVGEFHGDEEASTQGRLGDIRGRPDDEDLRRLRERARRLGQRLGGTDEDPV